jgi:hypothetical protein
MLIENDGESLYERAGLKILVSVVRFRDPALSKTRGWPKQG